MTAEIKVVIVEDDFYSRNMMELLLRRDWRTRVAAEVDSPNELSNLLKEFEQHHEQVNLVLIDTDIPRNQRWLPNVLKVIQQTSFQPAILFTSAIPDPTVIRMLEQPNVVGYVLKDEIRYSLAWAIWLANQQRRVVTTGVHALMETPSLLREDLLILDGRQSIAALSEIDQRRSRMVFIFSMERHELADEESISDEYSNGVVSDLYEKIGLNDLLSTKNQTELPDYFGDHPAVLRHLEAALKTLETTGAKKVRDKETLAFHLLTLPEILTIHH